MGMLSGKTVVLTGASQGLGAVMAHTLAAAGAELMLAARSADKLAAVAAALPSGTRVLTRSTDVTRESDRTALLQTVRREFGKLDVLINNAGIEELGVYAEQEPAVLQRIIETNLLAPMLLTRAVLPEMLARRSGHVVNVASLAGRTGMPFGSAYAGSKGGMAEWSISLAAELSGSGVAVSVICPGFVADTGMFSRKGVAPPRSIGACPPQAVADAVLKALATRSLELVVSPKPVRLLMALKAFSPGAALGLGKRLGLLDFLRGIATRPPGGDGR